MLKILDFNTEDIKSAEITFLTLKFLDFNTKDVKSGELTDLCLLFYTYLIL